MADTPQLKNQFLAAIDAILNGLINGLGGDLIFAAAVAEAPWLGWPIISSIVKLVIGRLTSKIYGSLEPPVALAIIKFQNKQEKDAYDASVKAIENARKTGNQDAIDKAKQDRNNAIDNIIHYNGS